MIKKLWNWITAWFEKKKSPIDYKAIMKNLEKQAQQKHLDKMAAARGGKKRKHLEVVFHNTKVLGTYKRQAPKVGRNAPCTCNSGLKSKKCCLS